MNQCPHCKGYKQPYYPDGTCIDCAGKSEKNDIVFFEEANDINKKMMETLSKHLPPAEPKEAQYEIPREKEAAVKAYAQKITDKYPKMSQHRRMKKVAEYFHLKIHEE